MKKRTKKFYKLPRKVFKELERLDKDPSRKNPMTLNALAEFLEISVASILTIRSNNYDYDKYQSVLKENNQKRNGTGAEDGDSVERKNEEVDQSNSTLGSISRLLSDILELLEKQTKVEMDMEIALIAIREELTELVVASDLAKSKKYMVRPDGEVVEVSTGEDSASAQV
jgi:hypothetical protein